MRKLMLLLSLTALGVLALANLTAAQEGKTEHEYVGVDGCKICHKMAKTGDQYGKWLESPHAQAYKTLASDEAKAIATKKGLKGNPQELDECLSCHVTAHGVKAELKGPKYSVEDGVECESCHGPGSDYKAMKVMKDQDLAVKNGLVLPTAETCTQCHNDKSPTFKGFDFDKMSKEIAHPIPAAG